MDFENYKDRYLEEVQKAISFIRQDFSFFMETKAQCLLNLVRKYFEESKGLDVLDVGCGIGLTDRYLTSHFRSLHGVDLGEGIIAKAKEKTQQEFTKFTMVKNYHTQMRPLMSFLPSVSFNAFLPIFCRIL